MVWFLTLALVVIALHVLYPLAVHHSIDAALAYLRERRLRKQEQDLSDLHAKVIYWKQVLEGSELNADEKRDLQRLCDDFERDERLRRLSACEE